MAVSVIVYFVTSNSERDAYLTQYEGERAAWIFRWCAELLSFFLTYKLLLRTKLQVPRKRFSIRFWTLSTLTWAVSAVLGSLPLLTEWIIVSQRYYGWVVRCVLEQEQYLTYTFSRPHDMVINPILPQLEIGLLWLFLPFSNVLRPLGSKVGPWWFTWILWCTRRIGMSGSVTLRKTMLLGCK